MRFCRMTARYFFLAPGRRNAMHLPWFTTYLPDLLTSARTRTGSGDWQQRSRPREPDVPRVTTLRQALALYYAFGLIGRQRHGRHCRLPDLAYGNAGGGTVWLRTTARCITATRSLVLSYLTPPFATPHHCHCLGPLPAGDLLPRAARTIRHFHAAHDAGMTRALPRGRLHAAPPPACLFYLA